MEEVLGDFISSEDLKEFEAVYNNHVQTGTVTPKHQFDYAWCLIRSKYPADIRRGVLLLEDLFYRGEETAKRDYLYYLAVGNTKLKEYSRAHELIQKFLTVEPANRQALTLETIIKKKMRKEGLMGMAMVGGATVVVGGLVAIGVSLLKGKK